MLQLIATKYLYKLLLKIAFTKYFYAIAKSYCRKIYRINLLIVATIYNHKLIIQKYCYKLMLQTIATNITDIYYKLLLQILKDKNGFI